MKRALLFALLLAMAATIGCGGASTSNSNTNLSQTSSGAVFVTGEDAPLASVVSFQLTLNSVTLNGQNNTPQVVSNPVIGYVDMTQNPPALNSINGTLPATPYTVTVNFPKPMLVSSNGLAG